MSDEQLMKMHGDHKTWSIERWRKESKDGLTDLEYIDWRADRLWCAAADRAARAES